jgi:riboflavin kinase/FMN adenylyltransferase
MEVVRLEPVLAGTAAGESGEGRLSPFPAVAVGNFDGVHRGHQALVAAAHARARATTGACVALTFDPHPAQILQPDRPLRRLMSEEQRAECLAALGVDVLAVLPFTRELAALSPEDFAEKVLAGRLGAKAVVVGEDFRFGRARAGDVAVLHDLGRRLGFEVVPVPAVLHGGLPVSSTRIREALLAGDVGAAASLLGRPYFVEGTVVRGEGRGRTLGIPTANLAVLNEILPKGGVYAARVGPPGQALRPAVVNLGRRPTFGGGDPTVEAHLLDFEADLYGQRLRVAFERRLRDERAFPGKEALVAQIHEDLAAARAALGSPGL